MKKMDSIKKDLIKKIDDLAKREDNLDKQKLEFRNTKEKVKYDLDQLFEMRKKRKRSFMS